MRYLISVALFTLFSGCSNFTINAPICDEIGSEPNSQNIPKECRTYNEQEADKAFNKEKQNQQSDLDEIIEFQKEQKEK